MANRYKRKEVLNALRNMIVPFCSDVYMSSRETVKTSSNNFVLVKLPQGIDPYADTHNTAYVQFHLFAKDIANGIESQDRMENLIDACSKLFPFNTSLMSCNEKPLLTDSKSDGMGYHSCVMQFKIVIKV